MTDLSRHVVAITGGARGIGRATAQAFLAAGADVAIGDVDLVASTAEELGCSGFHLDVTPFFLLRHGFGPDFRGVG